MPKNRLQVLYNHLEKEFTHSEEVFLNAEKSRHQLKVDYNAILDTVHAATKEFDKYPQATVLKRIRLIETLLKDLLLRYETERRHFNALGFLLSRLRTNLAIEMLEPRFYDKIRSALEKEENLVRLREKYPDAEIVITEPRTPSKPKKPDKTVRFMLISAVNLHYAIPVTKIWKKTSAMSPVAAKLVKNGFVEKALPVNGKAPEEYAHAIAYSDLKEIRRLIYCDEYFTPVEIPQKMLKRIVTYSHGGVKSAVAKDGVLAADFVTSKVGGHVDHRAQVTFYGRHFFVYGARLSYTVRTGGRSRINETNSLNR